jgi:hypothetical protein
MLHRNTRFKFYILHVDDQQSLEHTLVVSDSNTADYPHDALDRIYLMPSVLPKTNAARLVSTMWIRSAQLSKAMP